MFVVHYGLNKIKLAFDVQYNQWCSQEGPNWPSPQYSKKDKHTFKLTDTRIWSVNFQENN